MTVSAGFLSINNDNIYTASWYGEKFRGRPMACSGIPFNPDNYSAAADTRYACGERLLVTNITNNKSVEIIVLDRGGFKKYGRSLDLSEAAFKKIAPLKQGIVKIKIQRIDLIDNGEKK